MSFAHWLGVKFPMVKGFCDWADRVEVKQLYRANPDVAIIGKPVFDF
jgi:hypothetical protein